MIICVICGKAKKNPPNFQRFIKPLLTWLELPVILKRPLP
ncbi:MAG: hypothetical protein POELPBGB_02369 [Bacteroidia bacterium]|nr:hypothetical protein [Bacteroidia bacterium]